MVFTWWSQDVALQHRRIPRVDPPLRPAPHQMRHVLRMWTIQGALGIAKRRSVRGRAYLCKMRTVNTAGTRLTFGVCGRETEDHAASSIDQTNACNGNLSGVMYPVRPYVGVTQPHPAWTEPDQHTDALQTQRMMCAA